MNDVQDRTGCQAGLGMIVIVSEGGNDNKQWLSNQGDHEKCLIADVSLKRAIAGHE